MATSAQAQYSPHLLVPQDHLFDGSTADCQPERMIGSQMMDPNTAAVYQQAMVANPLAAAKMAYAARGGVPQQQYQQQQAQPQQQQGMIPPQMMAGAPLGAAPRAAPVAAPLGAAGAAASAPTGFTASQTQQLIAAGLAALQQQQQMGAAAAAPPTTQPVGISPEEMAKLTQACAASGGEAQIIAASKSQIERLIEARAVKTRRFHAGIMTSLSAAEADVAARSVRVGQDARGIFQYRVPGEDDTKKGDLKTGIILRISLLYAYSSSPVPLGIRLVSGATGKPIASGNTYDMANGKRYVFTLPPEAKLQYGKKGIVVHKSVALGDLAKVQRYGHLTMEEIKAQCRPMEDIPSVYKVPRDSPVVHIIHKNSAFLGVDLSKTFTLGHFFVIQKEVVDAVLHEIDVGFFRQNPLNNLADLRIELDRVDARFGDLRGLAPFASDAHRVEGDVIKRPFYVDLLFLIKYLLTSNLPAGVVDSPAKSA